MNCPICKKPMVEQTNKKNPKAPDWKCSDKNCKWSYDKTIKDWVQGDFVTGKWNPKSGAFTYTDPINLKDIDKKLDLIISLLKGYKEEKKEDRINLDDITF